MSHQPNLKSGMSPNERKIIDEFIKELQKTADQIDHLLDEVQEQKIDASSVKTELRHLINQVQKISTVLLEDNSESVLTRLALVERAITEIRRYVEKDTEFGNNAKIQLALIDQKLDNLKNLPEPQVINSEGKWRFYVAVISGLFTLIGTIIAAISQIVK